MVAILRCSVIAFYFPFWDILFLFERFWGYLNSENLGLKYWFVAAALTEGEIFNGVKYGVAASRWFTDGSDDEWLGS